MTKLVRKIGLVAHDAMKKDLIEWVLWNSELLMGHKFYCTGTTGTLILEALKEKHPDVEWDFTILKSGPLGGDQQMGSRIVDGEIDYLFFFTDPMTLQPHDTDVKALTRLAGVENIVFCCNRSTADHIISSPLFVDPTYERTIPDYTGYTKRFENKPVVAEAVESAKNGRKREDKGDGWFSDKDKKRGRTSHRKVLPLFYVKLPDAYNKNADDLSALFSTEFILKTEVIVFPIGRAIQAKTLF